MRNPHHERTDPFLPPAQPVAGNRSRHHRSGCHTPRLALIHRVILIEDGQIALGQRIDLPRPRSHGDAAFAAMEKRILDRVLQKPDREPTDVAPWPGVPAHGLRWAV